MRFLARLGGRRRLGVWTVFLAVLLGGPMVGQASASHNRFRSVTWTSAADGTVTFTTTVGYRCSAVTGPCPAVGTSFGSDGVLFGDGGFGGSDFSTIASNQGEDWMIGTRTDGHVYGSGGPFTAFTDSCCTLSDLNNNHDGTIHAQALVDLASDSQSPVTSVPTIVDVGEVGVQTWTIPAVDSGGQTLRWRLADSSEACGGCGDPQPSGLTINPTNGHVSWDTTGLNQGLWFSSVVVEAVNGAGDVLSSTQVTYLIRVSSREGDAAPDWTGATPADGTEFTTSPGAAVTFAAQATDPDGADTVHIDKLGLPAGATLTATDGNPASANFSWTPTAGQVGDYLITVTAQDDHSPPAQAQARTYVIHVLAKTLNTTASDGVTLGDGDVTDTATVSGLENPVPGATVDFALYGPGDATCTGTPVSTSSIVIDDSDGTATSDPFTPTTAGTYRWIASYSGDANNSPIAGACNDANENVDVARVTPTIATAASPSITLGGGTLSDDAVVSGRFGAVAEATTVTFKLYGPGDASCTGTPVYSPAPVSYPAAGGPVSAPAYTPTAAGTYRWIAAYSGDVNNAPVSGTCDDAPETTVVARAAPSITTASSANMTLGAGTLSDVATVSGRASPLAGATVEFRLYGPGDATCTGTPVFTSTVPSTVASPSATSASYTPTVAGTYRWRALYSGDANNLPIAGACNDANETTIVARAMPTIATNSSANITLGAGTLSDNATISGRAFPVAGATIDFALYGPGDTTCSGTPVFQSLNVAYPVVGGAVGSAAYTPTQAGTYRWVASYSGESNNAPTSGACGDANESTVVARAAASVATSSSANITLGAGSLSDSATVGGRAFPLAGATITFSLYGPGDTTCSGTPAFVSAPVSYPVGGGSVGSGTFTPTAAGTYRWRAAYSGEANNAPDTGACNAANETTVVAKAPTTIATTASADIVLGAGDLTDDATVSGRVSPLAGATITFTLYGPGDASCSGTPVFSPAPVSYPVGGGAVTSPAFTPAAAGTYRWIAAYSGDANNASDTGACNAANETRVVAKATPTISTTASADVVLGAGTLTDDATVTGRSHPLAGATITFTLYGPGDATCSGTPVFSPAAVSYPVAGGAVTSPAFTPTSVGTYRWIAAYSGDDNNAPDTGACNAANETTVVAKATPSIATNASANVVLGAGDLTDDATVTGRSNPLAGATITFTLYGPSDATCSGTPVSSPAPVDYPVGGGSVTSPAFTPTVVGTYRWVAVYSGDDNNAADTSACNAANESSIVALAIPTVATTASAGITVGSGALTDQATVNGRVLPQAGATVDFALYGPGDTTCSGTPVFETTGVSYPVGGGPVSSGAFTPTAAGVYRWVATYSGEVNNTPAGGECNDANENVVVSRSGAAAVATTASANIVLGAGTVRDFASVSGRVNPVAGAKVDFRLYGPGDAGCSGTPVFQSLNVAYPVAGGPVSSGVFTPTAAGTYRWRATYSGEANNMPAAAPCNAPRESVVVSPSATPPPPLPTCLGKTATIVPKAGQTVIIGTNGPDVIVGTGAAERISGRGGNDTICAGKGDDRVRGGDGKDTILGGAGKDSLYGDLGNDRLLGESGNDRLYGAGGRDVLRGGSGKDRLSGGGDKDNLDGGSGADFVLGGAGPDLLLGGSGNDRVRTAGPDHDTVDCGAGRHDDVLMDQSDHQQNCERVRIVTL